MLVNIGATEDDGMRSVRSRAKRGRTHAGEHSGCALETLFGTSATDDLLALAEPKAGLLDPKRLPEILETSVEVLDLALYGRVEPLGEALPELLALLRDALDLGVDLVRCHAC